MKNIHLTVLHLLCVMAVTCSLCRVTTRIGAAPVAKASAVKLTHAALRQYGARVTVMASQGVRKDPQTEPEATFDNNVHTRQVMTGVPYTFTIEMPFRVAVEHRNGILLCVALLDANCAVPMQDFSPKVSERIFIRW